MKISIIIPTYNPGDYLFDCLKSVFRQTFSDYEILIVLNGRQFPYEDVIKKFLKHYNDSKNVKYVYTDVRGVSNARNVGLEMASGDYICFVDDDDIISPKYLELLMAKANENTLVISNVYSFINSIDEKRDNFFICKHLKKNNDINKKSLFKNRSFLSFPVAKIIHKKIIGERRFDIRFKNGEDALFITSISDRVKNIVYAGDDSIYYVRERIGSASRCMIPKKQLFIDSLKLIGEYINVFFKSPQKYSSLLFLSRIPGVIKNMYILSKNK